jgi:DNA-binding beta-propeller fold protein YncE
MFSARNSKHILPALSIASVILTMLAVHFIPAFAAGGPHADGEISDNGAGQSSLLRVLQQPQKGEVLSQTTRENIPRTPSSQPPKFIIAESMAGEELEGLITNVRASSGQAYRRDVLTPGKFLYLDRNYRFTYIPETFQSLEFIRSSNEDKNETTSDFLSFTLTRDATVYVLYDVRSYSLPAWLNDGSWTLTGHLVLTEDVPRRVYKKEFSAGEVKLGGNAQPPMEGASSNYSVAASAEDVFSSEPVLPIDFIGDSDLQLSVNHIIGATDMLEQYQLGGPLVPFVHPQDSFTLVSGSDSSEIDTELLNSWADSLSSIYPGLAIYAATSGIDNIRIGAEGLDSDLFSGLIMLYEPNQENSPEFSWDQADTEAVWEEAAAITRDSGLEAWAKLSADATPENGRSEDWDYGALARTVDGLIVQTAGNCTDQNGNDLYGDDFGEATERVLSQYDEADAASDISIQVTLGSGGTGRVEAQQAIFCAQLGWAYREVSSFTPWWSSDNLELAQEFLQLRELLLPEPSRTTAVVAAPRPTPTPEPSPSLTPTPTPTPAPGDTDGESEPPPSEPKSVAIYPNNGWIYVADAANNRIQIFSKAGQLLSGWGSEGSGRGQFKEPQGIAVDPGSGRVYVADTGNHRVQIFTTSGLYLSQWGSEGEGPGQFGEIADIAVNTRNGNVFVVDAENNRIGIFDSSGRLINELGSRGRDDLQFREPRGIDIDPDTGKVYVADTGNNRVQIFYESGVFDSKWGRRGDVPGRLDSPTDLAINPFNKQIYVTDSGNNRVQVLDSFGVFVFQWGNPAVGTPRFQELNKIAIDPEDGQVYVSDSVHRQVQVFLTGGTFQFDLK